MNRRPISWLLALLAMASGLPAAQASVLDAGSDQATTVLASVSNLVQGIGANTMTLNAPSAGELFVTLTDLQFPTAFASLQFSLTDASSTLVPLADAGTVSLDLTAPMTLYADVFATSQGSYGLYNLSATFVSSAPVPLPPSAASLAGALLVLSLGLCSAAVSRSRRPVQANVTVSMA